MPKKFEFNPEKEREKLEKLFTRSRKVLEATLDKLESSEGDISAAMLDSVMKSIKTANAILDDLSKHAQNRERKAERDNELVNIRLPFPNTSKMPPDDPDFTNDHPALPFPVLRAGSDMKGV